MAALFGSLLLVIGGLRLQDLRCAAALLGAGCVRRRADADRRLSFHCFQGGRICRPDAGSDGGISDRHGALLGGGAGGHLDRHDDSGQFAGDLAQKNIKRMLAYSSIAHAGYALIGLVALSELGVTSVVFYLVAYIVTNLAAFGVVAAFGRIAGSDEIAAYAGLSRRSPGTGAGDAGGFSLPGGHAALWRVCG